MDSAASLARQSFYTTVFSQCFSPSGEHLVTCDNFGNLAIFSLPSLLAPDATKERWKPIFTFKAHSGPIYCLLSTEKYIISAGTGDIKAWTWLDILNKAPKQKWALTVPTDSKFDDSETNSIVLDQQEGGSRLFAGCGNDKVHMWDLESGQHVSSFEGHTDYVHCVALRNNGLECVSASEDGTVRLWDTRTPQEAIQVIKPYKSEGCSRPHMGKWIGCVAVDPADDFLVCGGGPSLSMWHLRSLTHTAIYSTPNACQNHVMFYQDSIISAGSEPFVNHWHINGDQKHQVPCSPTGVFNVSINQNSQTNKVLTVAGSGNKVDICTNFGYKAFSVVTC